VQLAAAAAVEVPQDLLVLQLQATREGADAVQVQSQLKAVLDSALAEARRAAQPGSLDVRTGAFTVGPRYGRDGRITGWQGTAELVLEGTDFARIAQLAGSVPGMAVASSSFRLSRPAREAAERDAQAQAVAAFRARAAELARGFGFPGFSLREVSVQAQDQGMPPRPRMMAMEAKAAGDAPVPVEAGKASVVVNVSGSVQLR
jgi:predicted secreted protein